MLLCLRTALRERVAVDEAASTQVGRGAAAAAAAAMMVMMVMMVR